MQFFLYQLIANFWKRLRKHNLDLVRGSMPSISLRCQHIHLKFGFAEHAWNHNTLDLPDCFPSSQHGVILSLSQRQEYLNRLRMQALQRVVIYQKYKIDCYSVCSRQRFRAAENFYYNVSHHYTPTVALTQSKINKVAATLHARFFTASFWADAKVSLRHPFPF